MTMTTPTPGPTGHRVDHNKDIFTLCSRYASVSKAETVLNNSLSSILPVDCSEGRSPAALLSSLNFLNY